MLLTAIFFVSFSTLAFEVLLTRVFAIGQWNHLSFMVLSIALFGFGASGTVLSIVTMSKVRPHWQLASQPSIAVLLCFFSATEVLSFLILNQIPLDYFRLPVEPVQSLYLLCAYLVLALPFFFSGLIISIGYTTAPGETGLVYFATMAGSALGALSPMITLPYIEEGRLILLSAAFALIPAAISGLKSLIMHRAATPRQRLLNLAVLIGCLGMFGLSCLALTATFNPMFRIKPSPYKALGQILQFPQTRITESSSGIRGRIDRVKTPYIHYAPGLSLKYTRRLPGQHAIFRDGDDPLVLYDLVDNDDADFANHMLSFIGYSLIKNPGNVLLVQRGGGTAVPCALASRAGDISIIEENQTVAEKLRQTYKLRVINQNPRAFLAQNTDRYAIIHIENWGASIPGAAALNQDHTFTTDAVSEYWNHLTASGVIIISRKLLLPPSDSLRLWGTVFEALQRVGVREPRSHITLLRNFDTFTLLVSKLPLNLKGITKFAQQRNFDLIFHEGIRPEMVNRFHVFEKPYHYREIMRLATAYEWGRQKNFFRKYLLDVRPQSDRRPFPGRFLKWTKVKQLYESLGSRFYALFLSGEVVVSLVFIEALILAIGLLILPVVLSTRKVKKPTFCQVSYFFGIGAGYMFIELYFIKIFILIFGDPTISFTLVVSAVLIFSSLGGLYMHSRSVRNILPALFSLMGGLILVTVGLEFMTNYFLNISIGWRVIAALLLILPVGLLMGLPFPLGMRYLVDNSVQRAYAWAVNGCASVLSAIVAAQLAISLGIPAIVLGAVVGYLLAVGAIKKGIRLRV